MEETKCAFCDATKDLQTHHWAYLNTIRKQKTRTTILCRGCHQKLHPKHGVGRGASGIFKLIRASDEARQKILRQRHKMEGDGKKVPMWKALDVLLGLSNWKEVK